MKYNNLYAYFQLAATETKGLGSDFLQLIQQELHWQTFPLPGKLHLKRRAPLNLYYFTSISLIFHF